MVNILGEPQAGVTTRTRIRDSKAASAHECLYVNFLSKIEPNKVIDALKEVGLVIAMQEELDQFEINKAWTLVPAPHARLVAQGYRQEEGIDFDETFVLIVRLEAIRILLAYAAYKGFIYVDDIIFGSTSDRLSKQFFKLMTKKYEMSMMGVSVNETQFRGMIGSLIYLTASRPDIQFSTCLCARYQANPKESHLVDVKRIFSAKKQSSVAMSSAKAEYVAASGCYAQVL
ncbi:retrovirus-related pol polyprotein from transposon TNT 1-94 [Tanacetum coccineum]